MIIFGWRNVGSLFSGIHDLLNGSMLDLNQSFPFRKLRTEIRCKIPSICFYLTKKKTLRRSKTIYAKYVGTINFEFIKGNFLCWQTMLKLPIIMDKMKIHIFMHTFCLGPSEIYNEFCTCFVRISGWILNIQNVLIN
jgi:hypothetical protein